MTTQQAIITWLAPEEGGRRVPPSGPRYVAPAQFEGQAPGPEGANWSFVVERMPQSAGSRDWIAEVHYLVDDAPHELLLPGARFELYEGKKCVARGVISTPLQGAMNESGDRLMSEHAEAKR